MPTFSPPDESGMGFLFSDPNSPMAMVVDEWRGLRQSEREDLVIIMDCWDRVAYFVPRLSDNPPVRLLISMFDQVRNCAARDQPPPRPGHDAAWLILITPEGEPISMRIMLPPFVRGGDA